MGLGVKEFLERDLAKESDLGEIGLGDAGGLLVGLLGGQSLESEARGLDDEERVENVGTTELSAGGS
jgi:hypothetical protein